MRKILFYILFFISIIYPAISYADKCVWWPEDARLTEDSQKAIIIHNKQEEVLILGTELQADRKTGVLEFIPFPSEPVVSLAKGNPFEEINKLLKHKNVIMLSRGIYKGGRGGGDTVEPVEIRFSQKIGLHDVTVIKINDINAFNKWVIDFLDKKGFKNIELKALRNFSNIAEDYIKKGFHYFVFDYVQLEDTKKFVEPLIYRFKTDKLYYPFKTSNNVGGRGSVELVLILPGSLGIRQYGLELIKEFAKIFSSPWDYELSTSSKVYLKELEPIYEKINEIFTDKSKIYLQMLRYSGWYEFKEDLYMDISNIPPYANKDDLFYRYYSPLDRYYGYRDTFEDIFARHKDEIFTEDEIRDYLEAFSQYKCIQVKSEFENNKVKHTIVKENHAEFTIKDCLPKDIKLSIKNRVISYRQSSRLVENGNLKNDLFAMECNEPFPVNNNLIDNKGINFSLKQVKISPLIDRDYFLYPTLAQTSKKLGLGVPHRTLVVFDRNGGVSYEFFCYTDFGPYPFLLYEFDKLECKYSFDEVLEIHTKNNNIEAIKNLAEKYFRREDYSNAEKAYKKLVDFSDKEAQEKLISLYFKTEKYDKARQKISEMLKEDPNNGELYTLLAKTYLYEEDYDKAKSFINKALNASFKENKHEAYDILGEIHFRTRDYYNAVISFEKALESFKKDCESKNSSQFLNTKIPPSDCELQALPYYTKLIESLIKYESFDEAEKIVNNLLLRAKDNPHLYYYLSIINAFKGEFDKAIKMADKSIPLFKDKGIGVEIFMGEKYPEISSVYENTPAKEAGLWWGDKIIGIGDRDLGFYEGSNPLEMITEYINKNKVVKLTIFRPSEIFNLSGELKEVELKPREYLKPEASDVMAFKALVLRIKGKHKEFKKEAEKAYNLNQYSVLNQYSKLAEVAYELAKVDSYKEDVYYETLKTISELRKDVNDKYFLDNLFTLIEPLAYAKAGEIAKAKELYREIPKELFKTKNVLYRHIIGEIEEILRGKM